MSGLCLLICFRRRAEEADRRQPLSGHVGPFLLIGNQPALPPAAAPPATACLCASTGSDGNGVRCEAAVAAQVVCVMLSCSSLAGILPRSPSVASAAVFRCSLWLNDCVVSMRGGGCFFGQSCTCMRASVLRLLCHCWLSSYDRTSLTRLSARHRQLVGASARLFRHPWAIHCSGCCARERAHDAAGGHLCLASARPRRPSQGP